MTAPTVKGWCPGALRPMMSGDGLILRIRPHLARLSRDQTLGLCEAALSCGSGIIDLTSRANLQIRGVRDAQHQELLDRLAALRLLDPDPETEARRNILCTPLWQAGDRTHRLHDALVQELHRMPTLPGKMGIAIDTGDRPLLQNISADFRFEPAPDGTLILRADGATRGQGVTEDTAVATLLSMMQWFVDTGGRENKRMSKHLRDHDLPHNWATVPPTPAAPRLQPGDGVFGVPFGQIEAARLQRLIQESGATAMRVTPWRLFVLENAAMTDTDGLITQADDPLLRVHACPGQPYCASATVETRGLARELAPHTDQELHVSGCSKGCAHPKTAAITLVGRDGAYDLVANGQPWEVARHRGLQPHEIPAFLDG